MTTTLTHNLGGATDEELVALCAGGDRAAFRPIVERYQSLVCSIAYSIVGDFKRSEEVAQEAFISAWRGMATLKDRGSLRAWISGITRNCAHRAVRRVRRTAPLEAAAGAAATAPGPVEVAMTREEEALVWSALQGLEESYREPLVLFYQEGQSVAAVAEALGISIDAVKQRLS